ncbi:MAG: hypothetical protein GX640_15135 [Fibrobacter sp.]|nr:hypothetical protein [Fibrobacter sp.]
MIRILRSVSAVIALTAIYSYSQMIAFNAPSAWLTLRNDTLVAKAQLDTAQLKQKTITVSLLQVANGSKKVLMKKNFKVTDYSMDFSFGKIKKDILGGNEFLRIEWSVPKTDEKGSIEPVGIVDLSKVSTDQKIMAVHVQDGSNADAVSGAIKPEQLQKIGSTEFATAWNKDAFFIVIKKGGDPKNIRFSIDGKNGKNAFLSYPDRIIVYDAVKDSAYGTHYSRAIISDTLKYTEEKWQTEISKETVGDRVVIRMPWYDTGIIPFEARNIGFGVFMAGTDGKVTNSMPAKAQQLIPGTYTDLVLMK